MEPFFDHERLEVYVVAREFNREIRRLLEEVPRGHADTKDNLKRAAQSVTRNIAEGSGRWRIPDKVHFYHMARGSATECAATLHELVDFAMLTEDRIRKTREILGRVVAMLIGLIRSLEARGGADMGG